MVSGGERRALTAVARVTFRLEILIESHTSARLVEISAHCVVTRL